jgi:hypothetical protein
MLRGRVGSPDVGTTASNCMVTVPNKCFGFIMKHVRGKVKRWLVYEDCDPIKADSTHHFDEIRGIFPILTLFFLIVFSTHI